MCTASDLLEGSCRAFSCDVTADMVFQNNEKEAMLVFQANPEEALPLSFVAINLHRCWSCG